MYLCRKREDGDHTAGVACWRPLKLIFGHALFKNKYAFFLFSKNCMLFLLLIVVSSSKGSVTL